MSDRKHSPIEAVSLKMTITMTFEALLMAWRSWKFLLE